MENVPQEMARAGDELASEVSGERIVFVQTAADTDGQLLEFDVFLRPRGMGPPEHIHLVQSEHFRVVAGTLIAKIDGTERTLRAGQEALVPMGIPHTWWNSGEDELHIRVQLRPAANFEGMIREYYTLVNAGKITDAGPVDMDAVSAWLERYRDEYRLV